MSVEILTDSPLWHAHDGDEIVHIFCCVDDTVTLCGLTFTAEFVDEEANCDPCIELDATNGPCPIGFICEGQAS